jgi:hypothetical protein
LPTALTAASNDGANHTTTRRHQAASSARDLAERRTTTWCRAKSSRRSAAGPIADSACRSQCGVARRPRLSRRSNDDRLPTALTASIERRRQPYDYSPPTSRDLQKVERRPRANGAHGKHRTTAPTIRLLAATTYDRANVERRPPDPRNGRERANTSDCPIWPYRVARARPRDFIANY